MPLILPLGWQAYSLASKQYVRVAKTSKTKSDVPTVDFMVFVPIFELGVVLKRYLCRDCDDQTGLSSISGQTVCQYSAQCKEVFF